MLVTSGFTMAQAKRDFEMGYMETFNIQRETFCVLPQQPHWVVFLKAGTNRGPLLAARGGRAREFKTIDAAVAAIEQIGFRVEALFRG